MDNKVPVIITNPNEDNININIGVNNVSITKSLGSISGILFVILSTLKENYNEYILYYYDYILCNISIFVISVSYQVLNAYRI